MKEDHIPPWLVPAGNSLEFTEITIPDALLSEHSLAAGRWVCSMSSRAASNLSTLNKRGTHRFRFGSGNHTPRGVTSCSLDGRGALSHRLLPGSGERIVQTLVRCIRGRKQGAPVFQTLPSRHSRACGTSGLTPSTIVVTVCAVNLLSFLVAFRFAARTYWQTCSRGNRQPYLARAGTIPCGSLSAIDLPPKRPIPARER